MEQADVVVIGAGVVGLAIARHLSLAGREVLVLESAEAIGTGVSSRNSEVLHAGLYYNQNSLKARLCVAGKHLLRAYCRERAIGLQSMRKARRGREAGAIARTHRHKGTGRAQRR